MQIWGMIMGYEFGFMVENSRNLIVAFIISYFQLIKENEIL